MIEPLWLLIVAVCLLVVSCFNDGGKYPEIWRAVGVLALGLVGWHFFGVWGVLAAAGLSLCKKI